MSEEKPVKTRRTKQEIEEKETLMDSLSKKFPEKQIRHRLVEQDGKEKVFDYISGDKIIERLNQCVGGKWNFIIIDKVIDMREGQVAILGRLSLSIDGETISKEQWGGTYIRTNTNRQIVCLGDDLKIATTDCMKKCATLFGVGLYLYDKDYEDNFAIPGYLPPVTKEDKSIVEEYKKVIDDKDRSCTKAQFSTIQKIIRENGIEEQKVVEKYGHEIREFSFSDAADFIIRWQSHFKQEDPAEEVKTVVEVTAQEV